MKKLSIILIACFIFQLFSIGVTADTVATEIETEDNLSNTEEIALDYAPNEIVLLTNYLVDLSEYEGSTSYEFNGVQITDIKPLFYDVTEEQIAKRIEKIGYMFSYRITILPEITVEEAVAILNADEDIISAEPNYIIEMEYEPIEDTSINSGNNATLNGGSASVNSAADTGAINQWAHTYLDVESAWGDGFVGSSDITVVILDSGFIQTDDLQNNLNMDLAWDVTDNDSDVGYTLSEHGNKVAGIIGADYNDGGVNGLCKYVNMVPVKVTRDDGVRYSHYYNAGIEYAIQIDADIINLSGSMPTLDSTIRSYINTNQFLFVTSAGNNGKDMQKDGDCAGKVHHDRLWIVVGAVNQDETIHEDSNYSSVYCDIFAPGNSVPTTGNTGTVTGGYTSIATPHVTAACVSIMALAKHLSPLGVRAMIMNNVKEVTGLTGYCVSGGILSLTGIVDGIYNENRGQYGSYTKGDVNNDGYVNSTDATIAKQMYFGTYETNANNLSAADVNFDGSFTAMDYIYIQRYCNRTYYFTPYEVT